MSKLYKNIKAFFLNFAFCFSLLFKSSKKTVIFLLITNIIVSLCPFIDLYIVKMLIDNLMAIMTNTETAPQYLSAIITLLMLFGLTKMVIGFLQNYILKLNVLQIRYLLAYIKIELMKKSTQVDISYFDIPKNFDELNKSRQNAHSMHEIVFSVSRAISNLIFFITNLILALSINWVITLLVFVFVIPQYVFNHSIQKKNYEFEKAQYRKGRFSNYLYNLVFDKSAAKEMRIFNIGDYIINWYTKTQKELTKEQNEFSNRINFKNILVEIPSTILQIFVKIYIAYRILMRLNTLGDYAYITGIYENLNGSISSLINTISTYIGYNERINDFKHYFMLRESLVKSGDKTVDNIESIEFRNVSFSYPNSDVVLKNVSFTITENEKVLLIGLNGSGKSTLLKLLTRFYDPRDGSIYVNGIDICECDIDSLREKVSTVFQDFTTLSFTIKENIQFGDLNNQHSDSEIISALEFSGFNNSDYLKSKNIDLYINKDFEEDGIELSGGQKQKLAISRAIIKNSQLIILDEPTASLDPLSESEILDAFNSLYENKMLIMVSHRLSAAVKMDKIIFLEDGTLIAIGKHKVLYKDSQKYKDLFDLQADKYK